ncbi:MAG: hypothetical protein EA421_04985 [Gemmatimonadales bacterium]|nr:MAG: hypothetical protein EA421_04985 [Gemmatimonadales bacterium]
MHEASCIQLHDWERLQITLQRRGLRYSRRDGLLDEEVTADMLEWQATGGLFASWMLSVLDGNIDLSVRIENSDPAGLERLCPGYGGGRKTNRSDDPPPS